MGDLLCSLVQHLAGNEPVQVVAALEAAVISGSPATWAAARISIRVKSAPTNTLPGAGTNSFRKRGSFGICCRFGCEQDTRPETVPATR